MNSNKANLVAFICLITTKYLLGIINRLPCLGSECHDASIGLDLFEEYMRKVRLKKLPSQIFLHSRCSMGMYQLNKCSWCYVGMSLVLNFSLFRCLFPSQFKYLRAQVESILK